MEAGFLLEEFAGVGPFERVGHGGVVVGDELAELGFQFGHRFDSSSATDLKLLPRRHFRGRMPKKISIWFSHELCLGR